MSTDPDSLNVPCDRHAASYGPEVCAACILELCARADALELRASNLRVQVDFFLKQMAEKKLVEG